MAHNISIYLVRIYQSILSRMMSHLIYWFNSFILILLQFPRLTENDSVAFGRTTRIRTEDGISPLDYESSTCNRTVSVLYLARVERFELPTCYVEDNCSIQLNYTLLLSLHCTRVYSVYNTSSIFILHEYKSNHPEYAQQSLG